jgi:hypothetical protein
MKNSLKRFLFGILSSAFLAVGLAHAANHFDPVGQSLPAADATIDGTAPASSFECDVIEDVR